MNCQEVMELMQRQLDDDLNDTENEQLMTHMHHCPDCEAMYERLRMLSAELTSLPKVTPSYSLVDAILPELERIDMQNGAGGSATSESAERELPSVGPRSSKQTMKPSSSPIRWTFLRSIAGVVAASVVVGLFIVTYAPDGRDDAANKNGGFSADNSMARSDAKQYAYEMSGSGLDPGGDVSTESMKVKESESLTAGEMIQMNRENGADGSGSGGSGSVEHRVIENNADGQVAITGKTDEQHSSLLEAADQYGDSIAAPSNDGSSDKRVESIVPNERDEAAVEDSGGVEMGIAGGNFDEPNTFAPNPVDGIPSPDGQYTARVDQHKVVVVSLDSGEIVMETSRKNGHHGKLVWSEDSTQLAYEVTLDQGAIEKYIITISTRTEQKGTH
ncbi:zf-HC2 domain-containing protein [Paenibacillus sp. J5C_2022]|uniref:anti-sigma factor family protein n=1 Tax=Paenibacillus sp. J5C2022 TaxID=2977129 RepID=UPI0021CE82E8|nr:zf-HC2 domain-containing protein [Paenibacillus sp. J5C2022]MCU6707641.1 zf-HC2 domain-containing protein [Paenibacillus sp. J5C2022]